MSWATLFILFLLILLAFFTLGQRIAFALGFSSLIGFMLVSDFGAFRMVGMAVWKSMNTFELVAIPLFLLMGEIVVCCNLSGRFYRGATKVLGRIPGAFFQTNLIACAIFAAISGSSIATSASIGSVAYPELNDRGYDKRLNLGTLGAGGSLGLLIPPSTTLLIYGAITSTSIAKLFIAGVIPGVLATVGFMVYVLIRVKLNPQLIPGMPDKVSGREKLSGLVDMFPFLALMTAILCSIYLGWATPTEAAAFSAIMAVMFAALYREFSFNRLIKSAIQAVKSSCMVLFIVIGAQVFSQLITKTGISLGMMTWFTGLDVSPLLFFVFVCVIYLILGCLMDGTSVLYFTIPLLFPMTELLGFDPIWFGVVTTTLVGIGMITPPVGLNLFVLLGITGNTASFEDVTIGNVPFVLLYLALVVLLYVFPVLCTWLPSTM